MFLQLPYVFGLIRCHVLYIIEYYLVTRLRSGPSLPLPLFYPPALGLPGFAQDNCIPEILFKT